MAISGVNSSGYNSYIYQWQHQKLQNTGTTTNGGSSLGTYTYNGKSTVSSMIELTKYAMDAMGVGSNARVTFSQVQQYKSQLEEGFGAALQKGLDSFGVAKDAPFSVTLSEDGKVLVDSSHPDKAKIQSYFDANPDYGKQMRKDLEAKGIDAKTPVKFNVSSTGALSVVSNSQNSLQNYFNQNAVLGTDLHKALQELEIDTTKPFSMSLNAEGKLTVTGDHPDKEKIQQYLDENPSVVADVQEILSKLDFAEGTECDFTVGADAKITAKVKSQNENDKAIADYFASKDYGTTFKNGLDKIGIDKNISFRLTLDAYGKVKVAGDHPDIAKVQKFFDDNPEMAKQYQQIQALADLDAARKAMSINPNEMRKRIEVESMAAWWGNSGNGGSSIGDFSGGNLSVMSGLNMRV